MTPLSYMAVWELDKVSFLAFRVVDGLKQLSRDSRRDFMNIGLYKNSIMALQILEGFIDIRVL